VFKKKKEEEDDGVATRHHLLLWCYSSKEGNGNLLLSPFSLVVLRFNLVVFGCL
jgi:hypothetical protein